MLDADERLKSYGLAVDLLKYNKPFRETNVSKAVGIAAVTKCLDSIAGHIYKKCLEGFEFEATPEEKRTALIDMIVSIWDFPMANGLIEEVGRRVSERINQLQKTQDFNFVCYGETPQEFRDSLLILEYNQLQIVFGIYGGK